MTQIQAKTFRSSAKKLEIKTTLYPTYSGVGMFGEKTTGVVVASVKAAVMIAKACGVDARTDSLGLDVIAY